MFLSIFFGKQNQNAYLAQSASYSSRGGRSRVRRHPEGRRGGRRLEKRQSGWRRPPDLMGSAPLLCGAVHINRSANMTRRFPTNSRISHAILGRN